jgi:hypothetical protein
MRRPIASPQEFRRERALRRLGTRTPYCTRCGGRRPWSWHPSALVVVCGRIICGECLAAARGHATRQDHHLFGQHNSPATLSTPGNLHDALSDPQGDWPDPTLTNPEANPLLRAAAEKRSVADLLTVHAEAIEQQAQELERLDQALRAHLGDQWHAVLGLNQEAE